MLARSPVGSRSSFVALAVVSLSAAARADAPPQVAGPVPPPALVPEAKATLAKLIAIDTTHEKSTEPAVELLAARLRAAGFADEDLWIVGPRKEKLNLVARLPSGSASNSKPKPILFLAHLDVVEAKRE